jgi:hypothetical protein
VTWFTSHWHWFWLCIGGPVLLVLAVIVIASWVHDMGVAMEPHELRRKIEVAKLREELRDLEG